MKFIDTLLMQIIYTQATFLYTFKKFKSVKMAEGGTTQLMP